MSSRSRYGRNICFVSVPFYFFAIALFLAIALRSFRDVHATIAQSFHANVGRNGGVRVASVVTQWARDRIAKWRKEGRGVHAYLSNARLWKRPRLLVDGIFALPCSKRTKRIEPLLLPRKHRRNACSCNGIETKSRNGTDRVIRSVTKSFNCSHASLSIGKWNKILTFRCVHSVFCIYKSKSTLSFVIYIYIYMRMKIYSWN